MSLVSETKMYRQELVYTHSDNTRERSDGKQAQNVMKRPIVATAGVVL